MGRIILENLYVSYGNRVVLRGITLSFNKAGFVALVGSNGAGKSTLAKAIAGVVPFKGSVFDELTGKPPRTGYVWQNPELGFVSGTVWEEVVISYLLKGLSHERAYVEAKNILSKFGLWKYHKRSIDELSGGYKQVLAIVTMVTLSPQIIIMDEITSMLDIKERFMVLGYLRRLSKDVLIILITQNPEDLKYADRVIGLHEGTVAFDGIPDDVWSTEYEKFGLKIPKTYYKTKQWGKPWKPLGLLD